MDAVGDKLAAWLAGRSEGPEVLAAAVRRKFAVGRHRRVVVARDAASAALALLERHPERVVSDAMGQEPPPVAFLFPGGGAQRINMGRELYETEPEFRRAFDGGCERLRAGVGVDLREWVFAGPERVGEVGSRLGQVDRFMPVMFAFCHALARQWMAWGVRPAALLGHSLGEYVAATLAGVFEPGDGLRLVMRRGCLIQEQPSGAMLIVWLSEKDVRSVLFGRLGVAAVNGPELCVVSGPAEEVTALEQGLATRGATTRRLQIDHAAHSWMMEGAMEPLAAHVRDTPRSRPSTPYLSNVTGTWMSPDDAVDPAYYARHLRQPVRFAEGLETLLGRPGLVLVEVGPGQALSVLARQHPKRSPDQRVVSSLFGLKDEDSASLLLAAGRLWCAGVELDWGAFDGALGELPEVPDDGLALAESTGPTQDLGGGGREDHAPRVGLEQSLATIWAGLLKQPSIEDRRQSFFDLGGHSLLALQLVRRIREVWSVDLSIQNILARPDLAGMAEAVGVAIADRDQHPERARCRSLMCLQRAGNRPPLFVVPGGNGEDGELYVHAGLSEGHYGPEQPVYGFRRRGWEGRSAPHRNVEQMASEYLEELRTIQPCGPVYLHGDCAGGPIAFEMACQLRARGEEVGLLLLTDSLCPRPFELQRYAWADWVRRLRRNPVVSLVANLWGFAFPRGESRAEFLARKKEALRQRLGRTAPAGAAASGASSPVEAGAGHAASDPIRGGLTARHVGESDFWTPGGLQYWRAIQRYRPGTYEGTVHLLVSEERAGHARIRRWRRFAAEVREEVLPGSHWLYLWHHGDRVAACLRESQRGAPVGRTG